MKTPKSTHAKTRNALDAIPLNSERHLSGNQIFNKQGLPRLPRRDLYTMLEDMAQRGEIEGVSTGHIRLYRAADRGTIASPSGITYNDTQRNKSSLDADIDWLLQKLHPVRTGKVVHLWMDLPSKTGRKTTKSERRQLVVLSPGTTIGFPREVVLVSVIGKGSSLIRPLLADGIADLVLAGMPARLAKLLMSTLKRVIKE